MDIDSALNSRRKADLEAALARFLRHYLNPAFGTLPKLEVELAVLRLLEDIGALDDEHGVYELVSNLKVTRAKARKLIYERELRRFSPSDLDAQVRELLARPRIAKDGDLFILEVENPLVLDHLRAQVKKVGHLSDGSFSPSIVRLSLDAVVAVVASYLDEGQQESVRQALVRAGAPDTSFGGVLKATLRKVAGKVADQSGEALVEAAGDYMKPIVAGAARQLGALVRPLFAGD